MQLQHGLFKLNPILLSLGLLAVPGLAQAESVKANETVVVTATQTKHGLVPLMTPSRRQRETQIQHKKNKLPPTYCHPGKR